MESDILFQQETGKSGTQIEQSAYWKSKTLNYIAENPFPWLKLMAFKAYAWIHNFEQYNYKTYSFHKQAAPLSIIGLAAQRPARLHSQSSQPAILARKYRLPLSSIGGILPVDRAEHRPRITYPPEPRLTTFTPSETGQTARSTSRSCPPSTRANAQARRQGIL